MLDLLLMGLGVMRCLIADTRPTPRPLPRDQVMAHDAWWRLYHHRCIQRAALAHDMEGRTAKWN
jgi:hypothetical protein